MTVDGFVLLETIILGILCSVLVWRMLFCDVGWGMLRTGQVDVGGVLGCCVGRMECCAFGRTRTGDGDVLLETVVGKLCLVVVWRLLCCGIRWRMLQDMLVDVCWMWCCVGSVGCCPVGGIGDGEAVLLENVVDPTCFMVLRVSCCGIGWRMLHGSVGIT